MSGEGEGSRAGIMYNKQRSNAYDWLALLAYLDNSAYIVGGGRSGINRSFRNSSSFPLLFSLGHLGLQLTNRERVFDGLCIILQIHVHACVGTK